MYKHTLVSELNSKITLAPGSCTVFGRTVTHGEYPSMFWIDDLPVSPELAHFARALRKASPSVMFKADTDDFKRYADYSVFHKLHVCVSSCDFSLGVIMYGDNGVTRGGELMYGVYARGIKNKKIKDWRWQHHLLVSTNLERAGKNAAKSLVPYALSEIAAMSRDDFACNLRSVKVDANSAARSFVTKCTPHSVLTTELRHLIRTGVEFVTPEFKTAAAEFMLADAEAQAMRERKVTGVFISLREERGGMMAHTITCAGDMGSLTGAPVIDAATVSMPMGDMPHDWQSKIAVLSMQEAGTSVPGVGMKASSNLFWIEQEFTQ